MSNLRLPRDRIISREKAEPILAPHLGTIQKCCLLGMESWKEFASIAPHLRIPLKPRTLANFVNDHVVHYPRIYFPPDKTNGIEPFDERGLFGIAFGHKKVLLRFKKADDQDLASNVTTGQQLDLRCQQLLIEGWEEATWVSACYHLTRVADAIDRILITCHFSDYRLWEISVYDAREDGDTGVIPFPEPDSPIPQPRKSRVLPKDLSTPESS